MQKKGTKLMTRQKKNEKYITILKITRFCLQKKYYFSNRRYSRLFDL